MNSHPTHAENSMKTVPPPPICTVQSVTYTPERRVITLMIIVPSSTAAPVAARRRKAPFRLKIQMPPEAGSSFEPVIEVRSPAKP